MADLHLKLPDNVPGAFYVDETCVDCDLCRASLPECFARSDANGLSYVYRQPVSAAERAQADEARLSCPSDSIGGDGPV